MVGSQHYRRWKGLVINTLIPLVSLGLMAPMLFPVQMEPGTAPRGIDILHYTIVLDIRNFNENEIAGHTDLQILSLRNQLKELNLDLLSMEVDSIWIDEVPVDIYQYDGNRLVIPLEAPLNSGQSVMVSVFYHGKPVRDPFWGGFYFTSDYAYNMGVGMGSEPHPFGRCWYPCVDSFTDRASYDYFITVDSNHTAICPGSLEEIIDHEDHTRTFYWSLNATIPTYLSSVAVGDYVGIFDTLTGVSGKVPVMIYVFPEDRMRAEVVFSDLGQWLDVFESMFGPYRWEKIGFVAVPFHGGAMEHATAVSFSSQALHEDDGSQDLLVHEFAHSWFGNLVTCATSGDMWLNEGWASYCEALYHEAVSGTGAFKQFMRANHLSVLQGVPRIDQNIPIYGVPVQKTYSRTVYDKGADAAHTIRFQIGDNRFFDIMKEYFERHAFNSMTTDGFMDFLENETQENYTDLFNFWIMDRGFTHFSVDSFHTSETSRGYEVRVFIRQQLAGAEGYTYGTRVELKFMDGQWNQNLQVTPVFGPSTTSTFTVPFSPDLVLIDPEEKISDATIDEYMTISRPGDYMFPYPYFALHVNALSDSLLFRVTRHYLSPDTASLTTGNYEIDFTGYWTIEGMLNPDLECEARFFYEAFKYPGNEFLTAMKHRHQLGDLVLLYREGPGTPWGKIASVNAGTEMAGVLSTGFVKNGDYCLAIIKP